MKAIWLDPLENLELMARMAAEHVAFLIPMQPVARVELNIIREELVLKITGNVQYQ